MTCSVTSAGPAPWSSTLLMSSTMYVGGRSHAETCAHPGSIATGNVMPQASTKIPRTSWTTGPTSPKRSTEAAKRAPIAYIAGTPSTMMTSVHRVA